jgi:hypothetical protein
VLTFLLVLVALALGITLGRLYQWLITEPPDSLADPELAAQQTISDIGNQTRRATERIQRFDQRRTRDS